MSPSTPSPRSARRWVAGALALAAWGAALYLVTTPWRELGGLVGERARWLGRALAWTAPAIAFGLQRAARDAPPWVRPALGRLAVYVPAAAALAITSALALTGAETGVLLVLTAATGWAAGTHAAWILPRRRPAERERLEPVSARRRARGRP